MAKGKSEIIQEANDEIEKILSDEEIRQLNYYLDKWERDEISEKNYACKKAREEGKLEGKAEGEVIGEARGKKETTIKIAKEMKEKGLDVEIISDITQLSKDEVLKL